MKHVLIFSIASYQLLVANVLMALGLKTHCRYEVTCSEYAEHAILELGVLKGSFLAIKRVLSCQPFWD